MLNTYYVKKDSTDSEKAVLYARLKDDAGELAICDGCYGGLSEIAKTLNRENIAPYKDFDGALILRFEPNSANDGGVYYGMDISHGDTEGWRFWRYISNDANGCSGYGIWEPDEYFCNCIYNLIKCIEKYNNNEFPSINDKRISA